MEYHHNDHDPRNDLSLEQRFAVEKMRDRCNHMRREDLIEMVAFFHVELLRNKNIYTKMLGQQWGLVPPDDPGANN